MSRVTELLEDPDANLDEVLDLLQEDYGDQEGWAAVMGDPRIVAYGDLYQLKDLILAQSDGDNTQTFEAFFQNPALLFLIADGDPEAREVLRSLVVLWSSRWLLGKAQDADIPQRLAEAIESAPLTVQEKLLLDRSIAGSDGEAAVADLSTMLIGMGPIAIRLVVHLHRAIEGTEPALGHALLVDDQDVASVAQRQAQAIVQLKRLGSIGGRANAVVRKRLLEGIDIRSMDDFRLLDIMAVASPDSKVTGAREFYVRARKHLQAKKLDPQHAQMLDSIDRSWDIADTLKQWKKERTGR